MYNIKRWYGPNDCNDCKQDTENSKVWTRTSARKNKGLLRAFTKNTLQEKNTLQKRTTSRVGHDKEREIVQEEDISIEWDKNRYNKL